MKIFNQQRYGMFKGKPLAKYISYAIGEIILVVIGILIALAINNFNEQKKVDARLLSLKNRVLKQVDYDLKEIENYSFYLDTLQQDFLAVLDKPYDSTMVKFGARRASILLQLDILEVDNSVISMIDNLELEDNALSRELIDMSGLYKLYLKDIEDMEDIVLRSMEQNLREIEASESWYLDLVTDFVCNGACLEFLSNNAAHKARIASLRYIYIDGYGGSIYDFQDDLITSREELSKSKI